MKKLVLGLAAVAMIAAAPAHAQYYNRNGGYHGGYRGGWVAPAVGGLILGGVVGAALAAPYYSPAPVYVQPAPVYIQPDPIYVQPQTSVPYGYHYQQMLDPACNCYKTVLVPN